MRWQVTGSTVIVALSERNLLTLLHKLRHKDESACTIYMQSKEGMLMVQAEDDETHYEHPDREKKYPGPMHPREEEFLKHRECGASNPEGVCRLPFGHQNACEMENDHHAPE